MSKTDKLIGAYRAVNSTGWAGFDKLGRTQPISADAAEELPQTPGFEELSERYRLERRQ
ncbi:hypothetical protein [Roseovarius indicus]|uniref:hypothetical protein n=1 Tax=Roseovarius indicus TaxID=540747 RepID=UPI000AB18AC4|nr:hypothetical protein [Roseovarius indicus]